MKVEVVPKSFKCNVCCNEFKSKNSAENCLKRHEEGFVRKSPKYKVGGSVLTHVFDNYDNNKEKTTIIKISGEFIDLALLVENEHGERYWVRAVHYQTIDCLRDPAPFYFIQTA